MPATRSSTKQRSSPYSKPNALKPTANKTGSKKKGGGISSGGGPSSKKKKGRKARDEQDRLEVDQVWRETTETAIKRKEAEARKPSLEEQSKATRTMMESISELALEP